MRRTTTTTTTTTLPQLPADIWHHLMTFLPLATTSVMHRVCRLPPEYVQACRPRHLVRTDPLSWTPRNLLLGGPAAWTRQLRSVHLTNAMWVPDAWDAFWRHLPPCLVSLKLCRCNLPSSTLGALHTSPFRLECLWMDQVVPLDMIFVNEFMDTHWLSGILDAFGPTLKSLSLESNDLIVSPELMAKVWTLAPLLEEVRLSGNYVCWPSPTTQSCAPKVGPSLRALSLCNPHMLDALHAPLERLHIDLTVQPPPCMFRYMLERAPVTASPWLRSLHVHGSVVSFGGSWAATCEALIQVLGVCPSLEELDLYDCMVNVSFVRAVFRHTTPAFKTLRTGLCMDHSLVPPPVLAPPESPRVWRAFRVLWNVPMDLLARLTGLQDLDLSHLVSSRGLYRVLQRNAATLEKLKLDHVVISPVDAFLCGRVLSAKCTRLEWLSTRHWSPEALHELLRGMYQEQGGMANVRTWYYTTLSMHPDLMHDVHRVLHHCPRLERYEYIKRHPLSVRGATAVLPRPNLSDCVKVWDFHGGAVDSCDVQQMLTCLGRGASPFLREWRMDYNPKINDTAFVDVMVHWSRRPAALRERFKVLSLRETGLTCLGFMPFVAPSLSTQLLHLRQFDILGTHSTSASLVPFLETLLLAQHVQVEQLRLPFSIYGLVPVDLVHPLHNHGTLVVPFEMVEDF